MFTNDHHVADYYAANTPGKQGHFQEEKHYY